MERSLALEAAAACVAAQGRGEDEAALRDAFYLRRAGDDPGPAGRMLVVWRRLVDRAPLDNSDAIVMAADALGLRPDDALHEMTAYAKSLAPDAQKPAVFAAAEMAAAGLRLRPDAEILAFWLADAVLAKRLGWPLPVPLLAAQIFAPAIRRGPARKNPRPDDPAWGEFCCLAYARAAARALDHFWRARPARDKTPGGATQIAGQGLQNLRRRAPVRRRDPGLRAPRRHVRSRHAPPARPAGHARCRARIDRPPNLPPLRLVIAGDPRPGAKQSLDLDAELADLPPELRWREWMGRVEAVIFASPNPVAREKLAGLVGSNCNLELLIDDIRAELRPRPYDLVCVAGGWQHRTRDRFGGAIRAVFPAASPDLGKTESLVLAAIAYFQPATRADLSEIHGREVSRDLIAALRAEDLIAAGPRSPRPGAPYAYVTTRAFLARFGFESLRDLPDMEQLEDAGLWHKADRMEKFGVIWDGLVAAEDGGDADDGENRDGLNGAEGEDAVGLDQD